MRTYFRIRRMFMNRRPGSPAPWLGALLATLLLVACGGAGSTGGGASTSVPTAALAATTAPAATAAPEATTAPAATAAPEATAAPAATTLPAATAAPEATAAPAATAAPEATAAPAATTLPAPAPSANTGTITGIVTDRDTGAPVSGVYITVGYKGLKLATITGADGHYTVKNVPAGKPADVFGFHGGGYRYHNSIYDDHLNIVLKPGETYTFDFQVYQLNDPAGEPQVSDPSLGPDTVAPGQQVTFELTARGGKGGLSDEVFAASPALGRLALLAPIGGDRFRGALIVPPGTPPGDYAFAFFAASNECYDNNVFPTLILHVTK